MHYSLLLVLCCTAAIQAAEVSLCIYVHPKYTDLTVGMVLLSDHKWVEGPGNNDVAGSPSGKTVASGEELVICSAGDDLFGFGLIQFKPPTDQEPFLTFWLFKNGTLSSYIRIQEWHVYGQPVLENNNQYKWDVTVLRGPSNV